MSNLGWYQIMTTIAKKVGGPKNFFVIIAGGGYIIIRLGEAGIKKGIKVIKGKITKDNSIINDERVVYDVITDGKDSSGLTFRIGDKFIVLESDEDAILIEKGGDANNPYFVSRAFLSSISKFR